nr:MAG TPA: hypothetical protein [Caudoviricetes sp.]
MLGSRSLHLLLAFLQEKLLSGNHLQKLKSKATVTP